jgi:hypothetical protein
LLLDLSEYSNEYLLWCFTDWLGVLACKSWLPAWIKGAGVVQTVYFRLFIILAELLAGLDPDPAPPIVLFDFAHLFEVAHGVIEFGLHRRNTGLGVVILVILRAQTISDYFGFTRLPSFTNPEHEKNTCDGEAYKNKDKFHNNSTKETLLSERLNPCGLFSLVQTPDFETDDSDSMTCTSNLPGERFTPVIPTLEPIRR